MRHHANVADFLARLSHHESFEGVMKTIAARRSQVNTRVKERIQDCHAVARFVVKCGKYTYFVQLYLEALGLSE